LAFVVAWSAAILNCSNRYLKDVHYSVVLFYNALFGLILATGYFGYQCFVSGLTFEVFSFRQYALLAVPCVFDFLCLTANVIAYQSGNSGFVSLIGFTQVAYAFLADLAIFGVEINLVEILGTLLILTATVTVSVLKLMQAQKKTGHKERREETDSETGPSEQNE
jgi:drug/metabolite transporter (DMT)-like permease